MKLNRRDALQLGRVTVVGGSAPAVPVKPWGKGGQAATTAISRLPGASFPQRYVVKMTKVPTAVPAAASTATD